ncbi:site-specific integrase [Azospirillum sp. SYSU D00513]|uniref:site-specific integrase n=1 Tax=Azospirillum sp. SYSU D00513 TaxID=2812561 RepID=UPI001A972392|nr:site-specific integrase [Azospirillum sp. SYSU D00513]
MDGTDTDVLVGGELVPIATDEGSGAPLPVLHIEEIERAQGYADASRAASTRRAYASDWRLFTAWCAERAIDPLPADPRLVAVFLSAEAAAGKSSRTLGRRLAAIGYHHRRAGHPPPQKAPGGVALLEVMGGIKREHGAPPGRKAAADADVLRDLLRAIEGEDLRAVRDRALLAIGMAGALRRSEIVALRVEHVARVPEGLRVTIARSKTDQEAEGAVLAIPDGRRLRPVGLLEAWITVSGITEGFLFRRIDRAGRVTADPMSDRAVARVVKARAEAAGYDPADFAGHSLRAGFLTAAARAGASIFKMQEVSRHKSVDVLSGYVRDAELFHDHAGDGFL